MLHLINFSFETWWSFCILWLLVLLLCNLFNYLSFYLIHHFCTHYPLHSISKLRLSPHLYSFFFFFLSFLFPLLHTYNQRLSLLVRAFIILPLNNHIWCYVKSNWNLILFCSLILYSMKLKRNHKKN